MNLKQLRALASPRDKAQALLASEALRKELLRSARKLIAKAPPDRNRMRNWGSSECGSPHCIGGWMAVAAGASDHLKRAVLLEPLADSIPGYSNLFHMWHSGFTIDDFDNYLSPSERTKAMLMAVDNMLVDEQPHWKDVLMKFQPAVDILRKRLCLS